MKDLQAARKALGTAIGKCTKPKRCIEQLQELSMLSANNF